ncbi:MAG: TatD family hydrolase [Thiobacillaceae bacterium]
MLIDTHCHLDAREYDIDRDAIASQARRSGVGIVVPAVGRFNFHAVRDSCARYEGCYAAYGMHPMYIHLHQRDDVAELRTWVAREKPVAIGEVGLDLFQTRIDRQGVDANDFSLQEQFFQEQLKVARDFDLPVLLHVRRANDQVLKHLRRIRVRGGVAHAFNGSMQQAHEFTKLGFKLGFGGAFTYSRATKLRKLAAELPLASIVLETDGPDIPPEWIAKQRNSPTELPRIAQVLADLRGTTFAEVCRQTTANACEILSLAPA